MLPMPQASHAPIRLRGKFGSPVDPAVGRVTQQLTKNCVECNAGAVCVKESRRCKVMPALPLVSRAIPSAHMSTLAEIESAVTALPRKDQTTLLHFMAAHLRETSSFIGGRTGAELARLWPELPHLAEDEAADFERDLAAIRTADGPQSAPAWE